MANDDATGAVVEKRKPVFVPIEALRPGTQGHNLVVKVVSAKEVLKRQRPDGSEVRITECIVGDATGVIIFTARNAQVDIMKVGATVNVRNAKIDMFKGSMRLVVDKWGLVQPAEQEADFVPLEDNDLSAVEYELVTVTDD